jgi:hypothetical protein
MVIAERDYAWCESQVSGKRERLGPAAPLARIANLHLTQLQKAGVERDKFGDSTARSQASRDANG